MASALRCRQPRCRRCCGWRFDVALRSMKRIFTSITSLPRICLMIASSRHSWGFLTQRHIKYVFIPGGRVLFCISGRLMKAVNGTGLLRSRSGSWSWKRPGESHTLKMDPGDVLVLLSDGIYEYESRQGVPLGEERVARPLEISSPLTDGSTEQTDSERNL